MLGAVCLLSACAGMAGPREYEVPLSALQASLDQRFPLNSRFLEVFDIRLNSPRLALQPAANRLQASMELSIAPPFVKNGWKGSFMLSGMPGIDPARNAVVLLDPRIEAMNIDGADPQYSRQINRIGSLLVEQVFRDMALYQFNPGDFRYGGTSFFPTKINARENGLVVTFEPVR